MPWWLWLPSWPFRQARPEPRDEARPRQRVGGCGRPGRPRWTPTDLRRRYLISGRVRATPCSSDRVPLRARALEFSLAPKRSLTSRARTFAGHSFLFFHNYGLLLIERLPNTARSLSCTALRRARATWVTRNSSSHRPSRHHQTPRPEPRPRYHCPRASRPARTISVSSRTVRHTTQVRFGAMPRPPQPRLLPSRSRSPGRCRILPRRSPQRLR